MQALCIKRGVAEIIAQLPWACRQLRKLIGNRSVRLLLVWRCIWAQQGQETGLGVKKFGLCLHEASCTLLCAHFLFTNRAFLRLPKVTLRDVSLSAINTFLQGSSKLKTGFWGIRVLNEQN